MSDLAASTPARELRAAYDDQIRPRMSGGDTDAATVAQVGPLRRMTSREGRGLIIYRDLAGLREADLDRLIIEQREHFERTGTAVEWKYHDYDEPADLPDRLAAAGFVPDETEALLLGEAADLAIAPRSASGITLRQINSRHDLNRIRALMETVWGRPHDWLPDALEAGIGSEHDPTTVVVAEADDEVLSAAWLRCHTGTQFASLWGGSTLRQWRGKGIYRRLVARRAQLALAQGFRYLQVDCSPDSGPILRRMGMKQVATTTPYIWTPKPATT